MNPLGEIIAGPNYDGETILTADLDLREIARGKFDLDVIGHYARPDVFQLTVNESPTATVNGIEPTSATTGRTAGKPAAKKPSPSRRLPPSCFPERHRPAEPPEMPIGEPGRTLTPRFGELLVT